MANVEWNELDAERRRRAWIAARIDGRQVSFVQPVADETGYAAGAPGAEPGVRHSRRAPDRLRDGDVVTEFPDGMTEREWATRWAAATDVEWREAVAGTIHEGMQRPRWEDLPASWQAAAIQEHVDRSVAVARAERGGLGTGDQLRDFLGEDGEEDE